MAELTKEDFNANIFSLPVTRSHFKGKSSLFYAILGYYSSRAICNLSFSLKL